MKGTNMLFGCTCWFLEPDLLIFTLNYFQSNKDDRRKCLLSGVGQTLLYVVDLVGILWLIAQSRQPDGTEEYKGKIGGDIGSSIPRWSCGQYKERNLRAFDGIGNTFGHIRGTLFFIMFSEHYHILVITDDWVLFVENHKSLLYPS